MVNAFVLLDADGIRAAAELARDHAGSSARLFDPTLHDRACQAGFESLQLQAWSPATPFAELAEWAHAEAARTERQIERCFAELYPGSRFAGWQHLNFYYLLLQLRWYSELWTDQAASFEGLTVHVFLSDNPAHYYWPSFLPGLLLVQQLMARGIEVKAYNHGRRADQSQLLPDLRGSAPSDLQLLTHLPTTFHDVAWIRSELAAAGRRSINLQARHWNVDYEAAHQVGLVDASELAATLDSRQQERIEQCVQNVQSVLDALLQRWVASPVYRERQARYMAEMVRAQLVLFEALGRHFAEQLPQRALISEHDAGFHGPLLSWAARQRVPVVVLPHSKTVADFEFPRQGLLCLTHPLQSSAPFDADNRRLQHLALSWPERFSGQGGASGPIRCVGLLLNGLSLGGVLSTPYPAYMRGIERIAAWCRGHGLQFKVRSRPGQVMSEMLCSAAGLTPDEVVKAMAMPLEAFAHEVDLCLMYDAPTNGAIDFLKNGIPLLNPVVDTLARSEAFTCNATIVPREDVESTLARADRFVADAQEFHLFARRQFVRYLALFDGTLPLRAYL